jgi:hypothetical protein
VSQTNRAYASIRSLVERLGGSMVYQREGYRYGAWLIRLGEKSLTIEARGNRTFPELDQLHVPRVPEPSAWDDYSKELVPDAESRLLGLLGLSGREVVLTAGEVEDLEKRIGRAKWKFAWTYARTYPHEYTTKALCATEDHRLLIDRIERSGVVERFGKSHRKYFYFGERKYWHMGDPNSDDPEQWPNVINRTWVDVRRHAENVNHVWTPEEVELQMRIWEIQLEKSTDRPKSGSDR